MKNIIKEIAKSHGIETILKRIPEIENQPNLKIAFIGAFSSGKTSLINSMLNIKLPVDIKPTTKSICLIEPTEGLGQNSYFKEFGQERVPISWDEFDCIVNGETIGVAGIQVAPCDVLPSGCIFVDTPGIDSAGTNEAELTFNYLSMIDAAIVCVDIKDGILSKSVVDFICCQELKSVQKRMVFALTHADQKSVAGVEVVKAAIIAQLNKIISDGKFHSERIDEKIFDINCLGTDNSVKVYCVLKENVLDKRPVIYNERKSKNYSALACDLKNILMNMLEVLSYDSTELDNKYDEIKRNIEELNDELSMRNKNIKNLEFLLIEKILNLLQAHQYPITQASDADSRKTAIEVMNSDLLQLLATESQKYVSQFVVPVTIVGMLNNDLSARMNNIEKAKDLSVTMATAVATAWLLPGGSTAANSAEAAGSAAVRTGGKAAASASTKAKTLSKFFSIVGQLIHDINPLEYVGDWVGGCVKEGSFDSVIRSKAAIIAGNVVFALEDPYEQEILKPLRNSLKEKERAIEMVRRSRMVGIESFVAKKESIRNDILKISIMN